MKIKYGVSYYVTRTYIEQQFNNVTALYEVTQTTKPSLSMHQKIVERKEKNIKYKTIIIKITDLISYYLLCINNFKMPSLKSFVEQQIFYIDVVVSAKLIFIS